MTRIYRFKNNLNEFLNVSIRDVDNLVLDVILDSDHILNDGSSPSNNLRVQKEY